MGSRIIYIFVYSGMWILSHLPFNFLYTLSDILYFFVYYVIRYRRKVSTKNINNSFKNESNEWRKKLLHRFYHYLCDSIFDDIKLLNMPFDELKRRMQYNNTEEYLALTQKHGGIIIMIPHYANYEWLIGMGSVMRPEDIPAQVYKPIKDPYMDRLFKHIRSRFGGYNIPKHSTVREIIKLKQEGKKMAIGLITDQSPNRGEAHYWTTFLHQNTVFMNGAEKIAKLMNFPVFYCEMTKKKRGYCEVNFQLVTEFPKETEEGYITEQFVRRMERTIYNEPAYWLWSHKRWKYKREDFIKNE